MAVPELIKALFLGLLGAFSAYAVNINAAVYHDGLRAVVPALIRGEKTRVEMAKYAYQIGIGFVLLYALPYALASGIILIHLILLSADVFAVRISKSGWAAAVGFVFGALVSWLIGLFTSFLGLLPVDLRPAFVAMWLPLTYAFPLLPAVAAGYTRGWKPALIIGVVTIAAWIGIEAVLSPKTELAGFTARGLALLAGMVALFAYLCIWEKGDTKTEADSMQFTDNIRRIRRNAPILLAVGGLLSLGASQGWLAGDVNQLILMEQGLTHEAALAAFLSAIGFVPLVALSGLVSGVWNQDGYCDWLLGIGYLLTNPVLAFVGGAAAMGAELVSLEAIGRLLQKRPALSSAGGAIRDAMDVIPTLAVLAGGVAAGVILGGPVGMAAVVGVYALNEVAHHPVMPVVVPPATVLILGLLVNLAHVL